MNLPDQKSFESKQQDVFEIQFEASLKSECSIKEITASKAPAVGREGQQFSVVFANDSATVYEQGVYAVSHAELGEFELFLVPVFGDQQGVHYEAIFT